MLVRRWLVRAVCLVAGDDPGTEDVNVGDGYAGCREESVAAFDLLTVPHHEIVRALGLRPTMQELDPRAWIGRSSVRMGPIDTAASFARRASSSRGWSGEVCEGPDAAGSS